jgi:hypothetical protein
MSIFQRSLLSAAVLVFCSLVPYGVAPAEPFSGFAMLPGVILGIYGSALFSGNPRGVEIAPMLIITILVNFFFWTLVCYAAFSTFRRFSK